MFVLILLSILVSCSEIYDSGSSIERSDVEDMWWEIKNHNICFNIHSTGDLLTYQERIYNEGGWTYEEPLTYWVNQEKYIVYEKNDDMYIQWNTIKKVCVGKRP